MKDPLMKGTLPIYARMLADSCGVQVQFGHSVPATDGDTVFLPDLPLDDPDSKALAYGMIMHEAGHITETSFAVDKINSVIADMSGRLEDIRMEACQIRKYRGGRQRLDTMVEALIKTGYFRAPASTGTPNEVMAAYVLYDLRVHVLGQSALSAYAAMAEQACRKVLPEAAVTRLGVLMHQVVDCKNTAQTVALATEIVKMLEEEQKNAEEQAQQQSKPKGSPSQGDDAASSQGDKPSQGGDSAPGSCDDSSSPDASANDSAKADNLKNILSGTDNKGMVDVGDLLKDALGKISMEHQYETVTMPVAKKISRGFGDASSMIARVSTETRALRRRLANELEAVAQSHRRIARTGGRLATNRLYRLETLNPRVFERKESGEVINTAVSVLIDRSGSMSSRIGLAVDAAFGLYFALDKIHGVVTQVATFPYDVTGAIGQGVGMLADFNDKLVERAPSFTSVTASGSTPLAEAMLWSGAELVRRKEARKILFICTDGEPDDGTKVMQVRDLLKTEGIEIMCLGIKHDAHHYFPDSRTIHSMAEMPHAVFEMMQRKLLRKAA